MKEAQNIASTQQQQRKEKQWKPLKYQRKRDMFASVSAAAVVRIETNTLTTSPRQIILFLSQSISLITVINAHNNIKSIEETYKSFA